MLVDDSRRVLVIEQSIIEGRYELHGAGTSGSTQASSGDIAAEWPSDKGPKSLPLPMLNRRSWVGGT